MTEQRKVTIAAHTRDRPAILALKPIPMLFKERARASERHSRRIREELLLFSVMIGVGKGWDFLFRRYFWQDAIINLNI